MESLTVGTLAGTGSFRCDSCGYVLRLAAADALPPCPGCNGDQFIRASLFAPRFRRDASVEESAEARSELMKDAANAMADPGEYIVYEEGGRACVAALRADWTRIGRSLAADVRLDDPTVSRRHALIVRGPDGLRVLDDRSLNGVFVNGERIEWKALEDGDAIAVGRYRLHFVVATGRPTERADPELNTAG